jgi:hypothetical protein
MNGKSPGQTGTRPGARAVPGRCLPTTGDTQVIRRTTTQPVRSIKGQRAADRYSHFLDHVSHINWRNRVAHQLSDHRPSAPASRPLPNYPIEKSRRRRKLRRVRRSPRRALALGRPARRARAVPGSRPL